MHATMSDPRLSKLLLLWEEIRDCGEVVTAQELCRSCPELCDELERQIGALARMDAVVALAQSATEPHNDASPPSPGPAEHWPEIPGYVVLDELGRGGMGVVYKARQLRPNRLVAIKMLLGGRRPSGADLARFRREAEAVAGLHHPNVVAVYEVGDHGGHPFCSMEYVAGRSLPDWIAGKPLPPRAAAQLVRTLAEAIHAVHLRGVVHRDLKPSNILMEVGDPDCDGATMGKSGQWPPDAVPKISDFGLARRLDEADALTVSGEILGTPSYMAPEQARGDLGQIGPATDVYGLGAILYELLTGRPPFQADTPWDTLRQVAAGEPPCPRSVRPHVPLDLQTICMKCLEKDPARRYASAAALAEDLRRFLESEPIAARPLGAVGRMVKWSRRHPAGAGLLAVLILAMLGFSGGGMLYTARITKALRETEVQAEESRQRLVRLNVAQGTRLLDEGDWFRALPWFVEALRLDEGRGEAEEAHRVRIAATVRQSPRLVRLWFHQGAVLCVRFTADGRRLLTASADGTARLWDVGRDEPPLPPLVHGSPLNDACASRDGTIVATAGADGMAKVWSAATGALVCTPLRHAGPVNSCEISPDGQRLLTASDDETACLWDTETGKRLTEPFRHAGPVRKAVFDATAGLVATASDDGTARLWETASGRPIADRLRHGGSVLDVAFAPDGTRVVTASADGTACIWSVRTGERLFTLRHRKAVVRAVFSPEGNRLATASDDHTGSLWTIVGRDPAGKSLPHRSGVGVVGFSADGRLAVTGADDNVACIWEAGQGEAVPPALPHSGSVNDVRFSPDGRFLATVSNDHAVRLWEIRAPQPSEERPSTMPEFTRRQQTQRWLSGDRRFAAVLEGDLRIRVCEARSGKPVGPPLEHSSTVTYAAFSEDAHQLVTAGDNNRAYLWDWAAGEVLATPLRHAGSVSYAAFSPDGRRVVTACVDHTFRAWDTATGEPLTPWLGCDHAVRRAAFSPDNTRLTLDFSEGPPQTIDLTPSGENAADLQALAELLAGGRIDASRGFLPFSPERLRSVWQRRSRLHP